MYDREYEGYTLNFEASGGLLHDSLVLQDKETSSYWSIIQGVSIAGEFADTSLKELPVSVKLLWGEWVEMYPDTMVLSVDGVEHFSGDPYLGYFDSEEGFGGRVVDDKRLATKEPVFGFVLNEHSFVVTQNSVVGGAVFQIDSDYLFFYRPADDQVIRSTVAYRSFSGSFSTSNGKWVHTDSGAVFDAGRGGFSGTSVPDLKRMEGFDTFWYTWSPLHAGTRILTR